MSTKVIIFDFDGTLADTFDAVIFLLNNLSTIYKYKKVEDPEEIRKLKDLSAAQILSHFKISKLKLLFILRRSRKELQKEIPNIKAFDGIQELLKALKEKGYIIGIISSNSTKNIHQFLENNKLEKLDHIIGNVGIFAKWKKLKQLAKRYKGLDTYYIGDEIRDIEAAKKAGTKIISVSWGYNSEESLNKENPNMVVGKPIEIVHSLERS